MSDNTSLERAIEQLLFNKIASGRMVGFTVTVAHEIMGLIRNVGTGDLAQPVAWRTRSFGEPLWEYDDKRMADDDLFRAEEGFEEEPLFASQPPAAPVETKEDWREDPSADERWNAGLDYGMVRFCACLGVDPKDVRWDAATEELDGDVCAVIGNILRAKFGENFDPDSVSPCSAEIVGCGTLGCTDPNCDYGKGPLRCQSCGAVVIGEPQEAPETAEAKWMIADGKRITGETLIFDGTFIVAIVTRREDAERIVAAVSAGTDRVAGGYLEALEAVQSSLALSSHHSNTGDRNG